MIHETAILVIAGPTASGKTAAAVELAKRLDGELVNADSVQVYRGFDIGSAKPTADELQGVPIHLVDITPQVHLDAVRYATLADKVISEIHARKKLPILVGGTGLWLRALVRGLVELPKVDVEIRSRLEREADIAGSDVLHQRLKTLDPIAASRIHSNDRLRIVRALEVFEQTGKPLGELQTSHALGEPRYKNYFVVLQRPRDELIQHIQTRTRRMLERGWVEEVRNLLTQHPIETRAFGSVGYKQIVEHLQQGTELDETEARILQATRIYARRQTTWFRKEPGIHWTTSLENLLLQDAVDRLTKGIYGTGII